MAVVTIMCSRTGDFISVGLVTDEAGFKALRPIVFRMYCPSCGSEHTWSKGRAWLSDATDRRVVHGGRVIEVGAPKTTAAEPPDPTQEVASVVHPVTDSAAVRRHRQRIALRSRARSRSAALDPQLALPAPSEAEPKKTAVPDAEVAA